MMARVLLICCLTAIHSTVFSQDNASASREQIQIPSVPHVSINVKQRAVDVEAVVCLHEGLLELVACTEGTKEHESIVSVKAQAKHIHLMLNLLGAKEGSPATTAPLDDTGERFRNVPAHGAPVDVFLVYPNQEGELEEHPINKFIRNKDETAFDGNTFIFTGSVLRARENQKPTYQADKSGNVITISSFGDELLGLQKHFSHVNDDLQWEVSAADLPPVETSILLRLRPQVISGSSKE
ncbi:YdjY domain-containing protein [Pelagicoccus mobilis]|uniref:Uncharacterized protein n=1 Tax=Pelagicoccus mobilis TaxID=415221 RepID=A0A934VQD8_9BACT|nr:YdjY domain-containing protein [Pelagicoccus mobilis]MBK1876473.1 hypothetical protein [Pelagicoccus mobilis]